MIQVSDYLNHKLWGPEGSWTTLECGKKTTQNLEFYNQEKCSSRINAKYSLRFKTKQDNLSPTTPLQEVLK